MNFGETRLDERDKVSRARPRKRKQGHGGSSGNSGGSAPTVSDGAALRCYNQLTDSRKLRP
jgi:hypothetical protein